MIHFNYETDFTLSNEDAVAHWITKSIHAEEKILGQINYILCNDDYLHNINLQFLNHDTLTDIISFDYSKGKTISGDIFISIDRVKDNAKVFKTAFKDELHRVIIHGILHFCGYKDKTPSEKQNMRHKEDFYISKR